MAIGKAQEVPSARKGLFIAENLGYIREKDGEFNRTFNCIEHRLRTKREELALAIDLYEDYYVTSWPTRCTITKFAKVASDLLNAISYQISNEQITPELEGIVIMEPMGEVKTGPLMLPITESPILRHGIKPVFMRINARQVALCCETATPVGTPLTGLIGTPDTIYYIPFLYEATNGLLPEPTLRIELAQIEQHFGAKA